MCFLLGTSNKFFLYLFPFEVRAISNDDWLVFVIYQKLQGKGGECDELKKHNIFKIVDEPRRGPFVSEEFKEAVEKNKLTGFKFELVWDSEQSA